MYNYEAGGGGGGGGGEGIKSSEVGIFKVS